MKQELQRPKSGSSKKKEMKTEGTVRAEASKNKMSKKTIINKGENKKSLSSINSNLKKLDTKSLAKKSKERNLDSVRNKEEKSRKRKKEEEEQNKPKSNRIKLSSQEAKRRKESKEGQEKMSSGKIFPVQPPSKGTNAESRKQKPDMMLKIPKATAVSAASTKKPSVGSNTSSKPEQGNNKKQKESGTHEKLKPKSPNSKVEARERNHGSFSKKAAPSGSRSQTQIATLKEPRPSSDAHSVKIHQPHKDAGKKKKPKANKHEIQVTSSAEKSGEPNVRRLKIMRALGLIPPAASPFVKTGARL